jgi:hypothetical protein
MIFCPVLNPRLAGGAIRDGDADGGEPNRNDGWSGDEVGMVQLLGVHITVYFWAAHRLRPTLPPSSVTWRAALFARPDSNEESRYQIKI